jgi:hypothetical protein
VEVLQEKLKKAEEKKTKNMGKLLYNSIASTITRIKGEDVKREEKLRRFQEIEREKEEKLKLNEEIHLEKLRAYELIKNKLDYDTRRLLGTQMIHIN